MLGIPVTKGVFLFHNLVSLLGTDTQNIFSFFPLSSPPSPVPCCCCCCCCQVTSVVSNPVRPQRRQPTRLPRPWDSPGKNTGVGCHFLLQHMKVKSESEAAQSCPTILIPCPFPPSFFLFPASFFFSFMFLPSLPSSFTLLFLFSFLPFSLLSLLPLFLFFHPSSSSSFILPLPLSLPSSFLLSVPPAHHIYCWVSPIVCSVILQSWVKTLLNLLLHNILEKLDPEFHLSLLPEAQLEEHGECSLAHLTST